jgi:cytochrome c oxidase subunit 2
MTLKVTGYQWYWGYEYPDHDGINFLANMIPDKDIDKSKGQLRLLSTDNEVVLPIETDIQILVTAADVLHAFAVPSLALKTDAVPGRTNETWVRINKPGIYYGQCSELCGKNHGFMPIQIRAVTKEEFQQWLVTAKEEFASLSNEPQPFKLAQAEVTE